MVVCETKPAAWPAGMMGNMPQGVAKVSGGRGESSLWPVLTQRLHFTAPLPFPPPAALPQVQSPYWPVLTQR